MEQLLLWQPSEERVPQANLRAFIEVVKEEWKLEIPDGARLPIREATDGPQLDSGDG